ncbi:hypothetical protein Sjap_003830 [Stephania japonica]|uniref:Uncharacterized protein n=1 Tax=Stephania japonica TaxID=461633 RepID=A0AAP0KQI1_9MAGN
MRREEESSIQVFLMDLGYLLLGFKSLPNWPCLIYMLHSGEILVNPLPGPEGLLLRRLNHMTHPAMMVEIDKALIPKGNQY